MFPAKADTAIQGAVVVVAQLVQVVCIWRQSHALIQHRLEYDRLEHPNLGFEWRTRTGIELLAVYSKVVDAEAIRRLVSTNSSACSMKIPST